MRPALLVVLGLSLGASAWLAWRDAQQGDAQPAEVTPRVRARPPNGATWSGTGPGAGPGAAPIPTTSPTPGLPARPADWPAPTRQALLAWQAPPTPPPAPAPPPVAPAAVAAAPVDPPKPAMPRFPYQWLGLLDDGRQALALLASAQRAAPLAVGQVIDGRWRLDSLSPDRLELTHLPSGQKLNLQPTSANPGAPTPSFQEPA